MPKFRNLLNTLFLPIGFIGAAYLYFRIAPLQADPHHDGVILAAAIGVSEGKSVFSGVFSQYGLLPPLVNGGILKIFGTQLITLRFFTAILCIAIAYATYRIGLWVSERIIAIAISFYWLMASAIWSTNFPGSLLPWPSLLATFLVLVGILLLFGATSELFKVKLICAGIFLAGAGFCRIQAFVIVPVIYLSTFFWFKSYRAKILYSVFGYIIGILGAVLYLVRTNSLVDAWQQVIYTPLFFYSEVGKAHNYNRFQIILYFIEGMIAIVFLFVSKKIEVKIKNLYLKLLILFLLIELTLVTGKMISVTQLPIRFRVLLGEPLQNILLAPMYLAASLTVITFIWVILKRNQPIKIDFNSFLTLIVASVTIVQLYPQPDVMHLWWISPLTLICIPITLKFIFERYNFDVKRTTVHILIVFITIGVVQAVTFINQPWKTYSLPVMKGTYALSPKAENLRIFDEILKYSEANNSSFDCTDGVYAVANGSYLSADEWFVNWGITNGSKIEYGKVRFICNQSRNYALLTAQDLGMELMSYRQNKAGMSLAVIQEKS